MFGPPTGVRRTRASAKALRTGSPTRRDPDGQRAPQGTRPREPTPATQHASSRPASPQARSAAHRPPPGFHASERCGVGRPHGPTRCSFRMPLGTQGSVEHAAKRCCFSPSERALRGPRNRRPLRTVAVAHTTHRSGASICDGTTHVRIGRNTLSDGTKLSLERGTNRDASPTSRVPKLFRLLCATASTTGRPDRCRAASASATRTAAVRGHRSPGGQPGLCALGAALCA